MQKIWQEHRLALGVIAVSILVVYGASLGNGFVNLDDPLLLTENPTVQGLSLKNIKTAFTTYDPELYIPLTLLSYQLEYSFAKLTFPFVYHLTNLLLHAGVCMLVYAFLFHFFRRKSLALTGALLFAVHPLHTEAVVWVAARKDLLATFFGLLSIVSFLQFRDGTHRRWYGASLLFFLLGLLSKVVIAPLPFVLLLLTWYERKKIGMRTLWTLLPYAVLMAVFIAIAVGGKNDILVSTTLLQKLLMAGKSSMFYLEKFLVPTQLSVYYPYTDPVVASSPDFFVPWILLLALSAIILFSLRFTRVLFFGFGFFFLFVFPTFANFAKGHAIFFASDRYAYLPSVGLIFIACWLLSFLLDRYEWRRLQKPVFGVLLCVVLLFAYGAHVRSLVWKDSETFNLDGISKYPDAYHGQYNLGHEYEEQGRIDEAVARYLAVLDIFPGHADALINLSVIYANQNGYGDDTLAKFEEVVRMLPANYKAYHNLGVVYQKRGDRAKATDAYVRALAIEPSYTVSHHALAEAYGEQKEFEKAIAEYQWILQNDPAYAEEKGIEIPE